MTMRLNAYLNFKDNARQAMEFYQSVLGGTLDINTFGEYNMAQSEAEKNLVMHSQILAPNGFNLMASDTPSHMTFSPGSNFSLSLSGDDAAGLTALWGKLQDGATVNMPLAKAPWGDSFGQLVDKFGTAWLVNISTAR
jgi:PhnB protein